MDPLVVSQIVLWLVVVVLALTVLALARQIGVLHERVAPLGALSTKTAVDVGEPAPRFDVIDLGGRPLRIGGESPVPLRPSFAKKAAISMAGAATTIRRA